MCVICRRKRGKPVVLPFTDRIVGLCDRCRGPRFLAHLRGLTAHG